MTLKGGTLEEQVRDTLQQVDPAPALRQVLTDSIMAALPARRERGRWRRGSVALVAATFGLALVAVVAVWLGAASAPTSTPTPSPGETPTPTAGATSPSPSIGVSPYVIAELAGVATRAEPPRTIAAPADCAFLADDWLRSFCALTLRSDWRAIIALTDPKSDSATWWAAFARAMIDGDTSFCFDSAMRMWDTLGHSGGGAPPPGYTPPPIHPIAGCIGFLQMKAAAGTFTLIDQGPGSTSGMSGTATVIGPPVTITVSTQAAARAALGVAPTFDPAVGCGTTRDRCNAMLAAVTNALGDRRATIDELDVTNQVIGCSTTASPCPPPTGGTWLGSVIGGRDSTPVITFTIADIGGKLTLTEVPYSP